MIDHKSRMSELSFHFLRGDAYNSLFFASKEMKDRKLQKMPIEIQSPTPPRGIVVHPRLFPSPLSKFWLSSGRAKVVLPWRCSLTGVWEVESWTRDGVSRGGWCAKNAPASRFYIKCWRDAVREKTTSSCRSLSKCLHSWREAVREKLIKLPLVSPSIILS